MNFHWIKDRINQNKFLVYWRLGPNNFGDYATKHYSLAHYRLVRSLYLHS